MITFIIILILINLVPIQFSLTGRKLILMQHPWIVRLRFLGIGMALAQIAIAANAPRNPWMWWVTAALLVLTAARLPERSELSEKSDLITLRS
jgi:hypothetical protein